jgi:hypothetical protein
MLGFGWGVNHIKPDGGVAVFCGVHFADSEAIAYASQCYLCCCLCVRLVGTGLGTSTLETAITVVHNGRKLSVTTPVTTDRVDILDAVLHEEGKCFLAAIVVASCTLFLVHRLQLGAILLKAMLWVL